MYKTRMDQRYGDRTGGWSKKANAPSFAVSDRSTRYLISFHGKQEISADYTERSTVTYPGNWPKGGEGGILSWATS
mgnify:CR=1 FL=1|jgi:hypothetical protein